LKIGGKVVGPLVKSIEYRESSVYPAWSGSKRKRCPYWLYHLALSSRAMDWPIVWRVLRWLVIKLDKPFKARRTKES
jgi:hypothetical protein